LGIPLHDLSLEPHDLLRLLRILLHDLRISEAALMVVEILTPFCDGLRHLSHGVADAALRDPLGGSDATLRLVLLLRDAVPHVHLILLVLLHAQQGLLY